MDIVIGIILIVSALFLVVAVLLQSGKDKGLSGTISGSASDTYYGKNKGNSRDKILSKLTTVISVVFVVLVLVSFVIQDDTDLGKIKDQLTATEAPVTTLTQRATEPGSQREPKEHRRKARPKPPLPKLPHKEAMINEVCGFRADFSYATAKNTGST